MLEARGRRARPRAGRCACARMPGLGARAKASACGSGCGPRRCASGASMRQPPTRLPSRSSCWISSAPSAAPRCEPRRPATWRCSDFSANAMRDLGIREGQTLTVALPPELLRVFDGHAEPAPMSLAAALPASPAARHRGHRHARRHPGARGISRARHRPAARDAAGEELPGRRGAVRRPCQLRPLLRHADARRLAVEQRLGGGAVDRHRGAARLPLRLRADPHAHAPKRLFMALALLPLFAPVAALGHLAHLHLRQPGVPQGLADGRQRLRADRHRAGAGVLLLPACADDPGNRALARRRAPLRGGRGHGHAALARVLDGDAARRALRPDLRGVRRVHAGHHRLRHRQGDRRAVQRARHRCLQAGDRPAELRDGGGRRLRAAGAGGAGLRPRPADAKETGGAAVGARRAARAAPQRRSRTPRSPPTACWSAD